ncbi:MAG: V-type ATP synthase subunit K [Clostridia bacterium]|nr:V-type ATP synthase subunit K [Clostridia bacterium]
MLQQIFTGTNIAIVGAALAAILSGIGSAKGVGIVGKAASGMLSEDPSKFGQAMVLQALPGTQGIYGLVTAFLILWKAGFLGGSVSLTVAQGSFYLMVSLPIAIVGLASAIIQGKVAAAGVNLVAKRPGELVKAITSAALVETYAIFALLISILPIFLVDVSAIA